MVIPGIDLEHEIDLINQGQGRHVGNNRYDVNGRVYVVKPDGGAYPESGPGVIAVSRPVMLVLRELVAHGGATEGFIAATSREPAYTEEVILEALALFEMRKGGERHVRE